MKNEVAVIEKKTRDIATQATKIIISNQAHYEGANTFLMAIKNLQRKIHETFDPIVEATYKAHKEATTKRKEHLDPAIDAEKIVKSKMILYSEEMDAQRREEQRKLELKAKAEEDRKRKDLEDRAKKWADKGNEAKAEELQEQAEDVHVDAPVVAPVTEQPKGVSFRESWSAKVVDEDKVPREYLSVNIQALNKVAQATKGAIKIPGVEFKMEKVLSSRSA